MKKTELHFGINEETGEVEIFKSIYVPQSNTKPSYYKIVKSNLDGEERTPVEKVSAQNGNAKRCIESSEVGEGFEILEQYEVKRAIKALYGKGGSVQ